MFARTTDGSATWEAPRAIFKPKASLFTIGNQIAVLPDGTLVNVFTLFKGSGVQASNQIFVAVIRSTDKGVTWSEPIIIDRLFFAPVADPGTGQPHRTAPHRRHHSGRRGRHDLR